MAVSDYEFELPDGRIFRVDGAPSREEALAFVDSRWPALRREMPIEGFGESFGQQFRGQITAPVGAAVAGAAALNAPEARTALEQIRRDYSPGDTTPGTRAPELRDLISRDAVTALKAYAGQAAGSIAGVATGALAGAGLGAVVGAPGGLPGAAAGAATGARLGTSGGLLAGGIDELYQGLTAEGIDPQLAGRLALTIGPVIGRIENRYVEQALSRALGNQVASGVTNRVAQRIVGGRAGGIRQTAVGGAAGETIGETLRQGTIGAFTGEANLAERAERIAEAGFVGALGGSGVGAATRFTGRAGPSTAEQQQQAAAEAERQAAEQTAAPTQTAAGIPTEGAPAPAPQEPYFTRTPIPQSPELLRSSEQAEAFTAANPDNYTPPPALTTSEARLAWVNSKRQADYQQEVQNLRENAISNFAATQPDTFFNNLAQAAAEGNLNSLNRFSANDVANAALRSSGIEPGRLTKDERKFVNEQLNILANEGILAKPTATSFSVSFDPRPPIVEQTPQTEFTQRERETALRDVADFNAAYEAGTLDRVSPFEARRRFALKTPPRPQPTPAPEVAPATGAVPPTTQEAPVPQAAPAQAAPQAPTGFKTALGSTYAINDQGQTIRTKQSPGRGQGKTYEPHNALFVTPDEANNVLEELRGGNTYRFIVNDPAGPRRTEPGESLQGKQVALGIFRPDGSIVRYVPAQMRPAVGLSPVELRVEGTGADRKSFRHIGNPITELAGAPATPPAAQQRTEDPSNPRGSERSPEKSEPGQMTQQNPPQEWSPASDNSPEADVDLMETANGVYSPIVGQLPPDTATAHTNVKRATRAGMGFMGRWFYSPILTASKLNPAVRPAGRAMNAYRRRANQFQGEVQPQLVEGSASLTPQELATVTRLREESSISGREAPGVANLSDNARKFYNNQIAAMNRVWDYWISASAIRYFDPAATTDPVAKARLNQFWRKHRNKDLWQIPQADLRAASPEGFSTMQELEALRNPYYMPMSAEGTHFLAAYKIGADGKRTGKPVKMVAFNPLPANKKGGRRPDPEVYAREELARRGFTPDKYYITPTPIEFTRDQEARDLRGNSDVLAKFLNELNNVRGIRNDSEAQNMLRSFMTSLDKAKMKSFMRPNQGIMVPFTALNDSTYLTDVVPRHTAALGKLQARLYTNDSFNRAIEPLDAPTQEYFRDLRDYATQPTESTLVARLRTLSFHYFIGPALDSMMLNMTSTYNSTMPLLIRDSGNPAQAIKIGQGALNDAIRYLDQAVKSDTKNFDNAIVNAGRNPKEREALRQAAKLGAFPPAMTVDMGAISEGVRTQTLVDAGIPNAATVAKNFNRLINLFGKPQQASEQINRAAAFLAAYRLAEANPSVIERANRIDGYNFTGPDATFEYAMSRVDDSQFIMTPEDRALILRATPLNELAFQFMSYPFKMTEVFLRQGTNVIRGIKEGNPELAKVGALGLMSYTVPLVLLAGVWGFPGAELLRDGLEELVKTVWKDVENFDQDLYEYARDLPLIGSEFTADLVTRGAPHALGMFTGSTRLGLNPFQFQDLMSAGPAMALGPVGSLPGKAVEAYQFAKEGDYLNALAAIMPRFAGNIARGVNVGFGTGEVRTPEGRTTISQTQIAELDSQQGVPTWIRMAVGLPPPEFLDLRTARRYAEELSKASRPYTEWANGSIARLLSEEQRATTRGDQEAVNRSRRELNTLLDEIDERNKRLQAAGRLESVYVPNNRAIMERVRDRLEGTTEPDRLLQKGNPRSRESIQQMLESRGIQQSQ
jgi:Sec-independent protein translocase protein TatA